MTNHENLSHSKETGIRAPNERDMTESWRKLRDALQEDISRTVGEVEAAQVSGKPVLNGFGINAHLMGHSPGRGIKQVATQANQPGTYLGVREGRLQEASNVTASPDGTIVSYARMPNFEPGHSPEVGEHTVPGGTVYEIGREEFLSGGGTTMAALSIDARGMVRRTTWSGQATTSHGVYNEQELKDAANWAQDVMAEITNPSIP